MASATHLGRLAGAQASHTWPSHRPPALHLRPKHAARRLPGRLHTYGLLLPLPRPLPLFDGCVATLNTPLARRADSSGCLVWLRADSMSGPLLPPE
ncbi:hypothetical protein HBH56_100140 [Parastagonospora nodorum]|uniref:Uncharacterized protein n=1 Tax=Phaeosphaeria nodorum (strain SN15 / ATCC MYA-4574 / FGSC 10173) TaxID=321614 RepID=A0A7U2ID96_PHANO|nr:hypothetical protein HBH56_100140 [Parastagonospora nodorum]QRD07505.1 hypothetical protein JI435_447530 [Parastagonospora nodorum SN15]KAH3930533.1 hypothetical protein HBH54_114460 [Parastagonospora nodorum]KAH3942919.1 hypothetical protein HBH53_181500 [Parastagonospora nodorum]KAH3964607.1 hypothetical protein HBH51_157600 [Parastagonospora nodorum]